VGLFRPIALSAGRFRHLRMRMNNLQEGMYPRMWRGSLQVGDARHRPAYCEPVPREVNGGPYRDRTYDLGIKSPCLRSGQAHNSSADVTHVYRLRPGGWNWGITCGAGACGVNLDASGHEVDALARPVYASSSSVPRNFHSDTCVAALNLASLFRRAFRNGSSLARGENRESVWTTVASHRNASSSSPRTARA